MFGVYFTPAFFPDGWGALGTLPEGSMSGSLVLRLTATGALSTSDAYTGAAAFSFVAIGTLTFTGEPEAQPAFMGYATSWRDRIRPGLMVGSASILVEALGWLSFEAVQAEKIVPPVPAAPPVLVEFFTSIHNDGPTQFAVPIRMNRQVAADGRAIVGGVAASATATGATLPTGTAFVPGWGAVGTLSSTYDDTEEILLALLLLEAA